MSAGRVMIRSRIPLAAGCASAAVTVAFAQQAETIVLDPLLIEAESDDILVQDGYVAKQDRIGAKVDTPIVEIPQAISVVTQDQLEDQKPRTLNEALSYTASANPNSYGYDTRYDAYFLRGFQAYYNGMFRDGLRLLNGPSAWFKAEPYGLEGVTILKGPASSLYGVSGPGGIVNQVTKRPLDYTFREVEILGGIHDRYQVGADFSGPLDDDASLLYRMTALGRVADTELEGYPDDKLYLAPALTWQPDEDTRITLLGEYSHILTGGTAAFYNPGYGVASDIYGGDPDYNDFLQDQGRIGYEVEHAFNDVVTFRQNFRYSAVDADLEYSGLYFVADDQPLARYWGHYTEDLENLVVDTMAEFDFATGPVDHTLLAGIDYAWADYDAYSGVSYVSADDMAEAELPYAGGQEMRQLGLYLHDQLDWRDFTLFLSGRHDWVDTDTLDAAEEEGDQKDSGFSGRVGLSYTSPWDIVFYGNYSTSFSPNIGLVYDDVTSDDARTAAPTIARQKEIGVKYAVPNTNAVITAALFDIRQEDGVVFQVYEGRNKQRQLDLHSQGFEIEANASFDNGFSLIASYTALRMEIEKGADGTEGNELSATPNHVASLWGHYVFQDGPLMGLGLGAGLRYVGESWGDDENTIENEDRVFVDASLSYDFGRRNPDLEGVLLQVNARNLFDERKQICSAGYCYRDEGLSLYSSLRYRF